MMRPFLRRPWFLALAVAACGLSAALIIRARRPSPDDIQRAGCQAQYRAARTAADTMLVDAVTVLSDHPRGITSCRRYR